MVTSIEDIKKKLTTEVSIHGWDDEPFVCRLKRVGILDMASSGKIPNALMGTVVALFDKRVELKKAEDIKNMAEVINLFCKVAMIEPTYEEVEAIMPLTDEQRMDIFTFTQSGVKMITPFPEQQ